PALFERESEKRNQRLVRRFKLSFLKAEVVDGYLAFSVCPLFSNSNSPYTKSEETLVASWIDLISVAKRGAILKTLMFLSSAALEFSGTVFVTTICSIPEFARCCAARPDSTGWVKHAWTRAAPACFKAIDTL